MRILCRFGYAKDSRVRKTLAHLLEMAHQTGGWRCSFSKLGSGPEPRVANPGATLFVLDACRYSDASGSVIDRAVESLLLHWETRTRGGPCHYGIGTRFMQVEYPFLRYNLFFREVDMEQAIPILPADDLRVAKSFYVDQLGFSVLFEASDDGKQGLLGLARGTIRLTIDCPMSGHGRDACVSLEVENADAYFEEWSAKVAVLRRPVNETWGKRTFDLIDPFGNTLFVMGPLA
ncbi:MAG: glyoxalase superfamily protein [Gemmatimonadales bacterium]